MPEQTEKKLTGYPSIDKPWLRYYDRDADERARDIPEDKTLWDVFEERLRKYSDYPAIEYFGRTISRTELIENVYTWASALRHLGIKEDEIIPYYGVMTPDVCAMLFALNMIGACPYFLKLSMSPEALEEETRDSRIAIVSDIMWDKVSSEFSKDRFEKIIILKITDAMPAPTKQVVSFISALKGRSRIPHGKKYISATNVKKLAHHSSESLKAKYVAGRFAIITYSSGTTLDGIVKGVVATNESVLGQILGATSSDLPYAPGIRTLNHFPPTAATSLNSLFFLPIYNGATVIIDPRVSENDFYNQLVKLKPNVAINTSSMWETFFKRLSGEIKEGKKIDLSHAKGWLVGGEGADVKKLIKWDRILQACGATCMYAAYGLSETFSGICIDRLDARSGFAKSVAGVGLPIAGLIMGVFDKNGKELPYNHRGELRVKTKAAMREYYHKPELTAKTMVDGWLYTGDLAEIDENGFVYIWGRCKDTVALSDGREIYLFDVANKLKEKDYIDDAIVLPIPSQGKEKQLAAHIVWTDKPSDAEKIHRIEELNELLKDYLPDELSIFGYAEHEGMLPYSPTTLKKDKNKMSKQSTGYMQVIDGHLRTINVDILGK